MTTEHLNRIFDKYDTDHSAYLSKNQFSCALEEIIKEFGGEPPCCQDVQDIFNALDTNGDENISVGQFKVLISKVKEVIQSKY